jgi:hypothetical protein
MPESAPKAELLRTLGQTVRGLSALFWGLPLTLVVYVQTAKTNLFEPLGLFAIFLPALVSLLLVCGLLQMRGFQKQERVWQRSLERTTVIAWINLGLSPFLYWWNKLPFIPLYNVAVALLTLTSLLFLFNLNHLLQRLTAMLPDETLRIETRMFTGFNRVVLMIIPILLGFHFALAPINNLPYFLNHFMAVMQPFGLWLVLFLILLPVAMTMALLWKVKEVIFASVFDAQN